MNSAANDARRASKIPLAPATKGLRGLMQKLGGLNARHEALVRRVDELEVITLLSSGFGVVRTVYSRMYCDLLCLLIS